MTADQTPAPSASAPDIDVLTKDGDRVRGLVVDVIDGHFTVDPGQGLCEIVLHPDEVAIVVDDEARDRANEALCRFVFPGLSVPRGEMADAVIVALRGIGDWRADLPRRRVVT